MIQPTYRTIVLPIILLEFDIEKPDASFNEINDYTTQWSDIYQYDGLFAPLFNLN